MWLFPQPRNSNWYSPPGCFRRKKFRAKPISSESKVTIWELLLNSCCIWLKQLFASVSVNSGGYSHRRSGSVNVPGGIGKNSNACKCVWKSFKRVCISPPPLSLSSQSLRIIRTLIFEDINWPPVNVYCTLHRHRMLRKWCSNLQPLPDALLCIVHLLSAYGSFFFLLGPQNRRPRPLMGAVRL